MNLYYLNTDDEESRFKDRMDHMRDEVLNKLSAIEIAALFNDFSEFSHLYRRELHEKFAETYID